MLKKLVTKPLLKLLSWVARKLFVPALVFFAAKLGIDRWQFKSCPFCAEKVRRRAVVCRHCGQEMTAGQPYTVHG
jgi:hypothetical protein